MQFFRAAPRRTGAADRCVAIAKWDPATLIATSGTQRSDPCSLIQSHPLTQTGGCPIRKDNIDLDITSFFIVRNWRLKAHFLRNLSNSGSSGSVSPQGYPGVVRGRPPATYREDVRFWHPSSTCVHHDVHGRPQFRMAVLIVQLCQEGGH